jgi:hypothetical protein
MQRLKLLPWNRHKSQSESRSLMILELRRRKMYNVVDKQVGQTSKRDSLTYTLKARF